MKRQPQELLSRIRELGGSAEQPVAVDIGLFFDQNQDPGSIAPNLENHPGPQAIYEVLRQVGERPDVTSVTVIVRLEFDQYADGEWPFGEAVQVVTSATLAALDAMTRPVGTDEAFEGSWDEIPNQPEIPADQRVATIWWD